MSLFEGDAEAVDLRQLERRRVERAEIIARIAGGVAHNFNNVLAVILGRVELMLNLADLGRLDAAQAQKGLVSIRDVARDAGELLKRLRDLTQPAREVPFTVFDVNHAAGDAEVLLQPYVAAVSQVRGVHLGLVHRRAKRPVLVSGQPGALREVLVNLILNAVEVMPSGGEITVETSIDGPDVVIRIGHPGIGMSEEVRARVFLPFFTTQGSGNSGLGLSSARDLVAAHGGSLAVASEAGRGTTVMIRLPHAAERRERRPPAGAAAPAAPLRVLLVEDQPAVAQVLAEFLDAKGCRVSVAHSGRAALAQIEQERYDVVITDLLIPEATGWEIGRAAKRRDPGCAVILLSGEVVSRNDFEAEGAGLDELLSKPVDLSQLLRVMTDTVRKTRAR